MPSMIAKKLGDLEAERDSFLLYERRIIEERDEILMNVSIHLDQLDTEIVRLGGTARDRGRSMRPSSHHSLGDTDIGIVSSTAIFPSMMKSDEPSFPRGWPTKSTKGAAVPGTATSASQKFERSGHIEDHISPDRENFSSDHAPPSSSSSEDTNKERARPSLNGAAFSMVRERCTSAGTSKVQMIEKMNNRKKRKRQSVTRDVTAFDEEWTCECGEHMAAGRARCGKCRRWKGGKRLVRWSVKPKDSTGVIARAVASPSSSPLGHRNDNHGNESADVLRSIDVYRNLCVTADLDSVAKVSMASSDYGDDLVIQALMEQIVSAVVNVADPGQTKETNGSRKSNGQTAAASKEKNTPTNNLEEIVTSQKRKRGRPKKEPIETDPGQIMRSVSNSDSDNRPEDLRKRGRPRKSLVTNKDVKEGAKHEGHSLPSLAARANLQHSPHDVEVTSLVALEDSLSTSTVNPSTREANVTAACLPNGEI